MKSHMLNPSSGIARLSKRATATATKAPTVRGKGCGTVACIAGWTSRVRTGEPIAPISPLAFDWRAEGRWLGLSETDARVLFYGDDETNGRLGEIVPDEAVRVLRHLAETGEVDWDRALAEPSK